MVRRTGKELVVVVLLLLPSVSEGAVHLRSLKTTSPKIVKSGWVEDWVKRRRVGAGGRGHMCCLG